MTTNMSPYIKGMVSRIERLISEGIGDLDLSHEVSEQRKEWAETCANLGITPDDPMLKLCSLAVMQLLFELIAARELMEAEGGDPDSRCVRHTLTAVAYTLALGIFGKDYIESREGQTGG